MRRLVVSSSSGLFYWPSVSWLTRASCIRKTSTSVSAKMIFSPLGNSGCFLRGKPAATESHYPTYSSCWVFQFLHNPPNSDMDYRIFNMRTDVHACDCTRNVRTHVRDSALKIDYGRKIPCRTGESNLRQRRVGPTLYQLSYISILNTKYMSIKNKFLVDGVIMY